MTRSSWLEKIDPGVRRSLEGIYRSYDLIGDIAVTRIPPELEEMRAEIGRQILLQNPKTRLVLQAYGPTSRDARTRGMRPIAGCGPSLTEHREHGITYIVDVGAVCFTPRLSHERLRVARQVMPGERVLNMFAGVGSFSLLTAGMVNATVFSFDKNPAAVECMRLGIGSNRLVGHVLPVLGDVRKTLNFGWQAMDRIIIPLPSLSDDVLGLASKMLKPGGLIYMYREAPGLRGKCLDKSLLALREIIHLSIVGEYEILRSRVVRSVGRKRWHVVHDIRLG